MPSNKPYPTKSKRTRSKKAERREVKVYGVHAVRAIWKHRPESIIRAYAVKERLKEFAELLKWCAKEKKAYHVVTNQELENIAEGVHHQGICLLVVERPRLDFSKWCREFERARPENSAVLFLDGVENPHNIGSILRVCSHFGIRFIFGTKLSLPQMSPSAMRVAEGGAEFVEFVEVATAATCLKKLSDLGFQIVGTSGYAKTSLYQCEFASRTAIILGSEVTGVHKDILKNNCDEVISIPGTGQIESLNVAIACGVIFGEYLRQRNYGKHGR